MHGQGSFVRMVVFLTSPLLPFFNFLYSDQIQTGICMLGGLSTECSDVGSLNCC